MSHAERTSTMRSGYEPLGAELVLGSRAVACWNNATEDFGLQMSDLPARCERLRATFHAPWILVGSIVLPRILVEAFPQWSGLTARSLGSTVFMFASGKDGYLCDIDRLRCEMSKKLSVRPSFRPFFSDTCVRFWMEAHTKPLSADSPFAPLRGRYCLDNSCAKLEDADNYR